MPQKFGKQLLMPSLVLLPLDLLQLLTVSQNSPRPLKDYTTLLMQMSMEMVLELILLVLKLLSEYMRQLLTLLPDPGIYLIFTILERLLELNFWPSREHSKICFSRMVRLRTHKMSSKIS